LAWVNDTLDRGLTHHLETVELVGHLLDLLFLAGLLDFDARSVPVAISARQV
jgi:hypothetical protein